jgi:hypothetical protein
MKLNNTAKIVVSVLTALVALFPLAFILLWLGMFLPTMVGSSREYPFQAFDAMFVFFFPAMCIISTLMYAMVAFYVTHAIKNTAASDIFRILGLLLVFFFPYLGMPAYYVIYILLRKPPQWAMKPLSPSS